MTLVLLRLPEGLLPYISALGSKSKQPQLDSKQKSDSCSQMFVGGDCFCGVESAGVWRVRVVSFCQVWRVGGSGGVWELGGGTV